MSIPKFRAFNKKTNHSNYFDLENYVQGRYTTDEYIISRCTDVIDMFGKEIYEHDFIYIPPYNYEHGLGVITYDKGKFTCEKISGMGGVAGLNGDRMFVVGNSLEGKAMDFSKEEIIKECIKVIEEEDMDCGDSEYNYEYEDDIKKSLIKNMLKRLKF